MHAGKSKQMYTVCQCVFHYMIRPQGRLYLADMGLPEIIHADPGLAYSAAYSIGKLTIQK